MLRIVLTAGLTIAATAAYAETYRLVHAIGNAETVVAKGLSKEECEKQKAERKAVATALGTYNEASGKGSIVCLPDSDFDD